MSAEIPYLHCNIDAEQRAVIEAAAGTGKTYNIARIVARIIMERDDVTIDKMVIVTFTRAAAGELKSRISQLLSELEQAAAAEDHGNELLDLAIKKGISCQQIKLRLRMALLNFDRAMIGTIHSFAMRILSENGFESNLKFGFTLNEGTPGIILELLNDFLRSLAYKIDQVIIESCLPDKLTLNKLNKIVTDYVVKKIANPSLNIVWPENAPVQNSIEEIISQTQEYTAALSEKQNEKIRKEEEIAAAVPRSKEKAALKRELDDVKNNIKELDNLQSVHRQFLVRKICENAFAYVSEAYHQICGENNFLGNDDLILNLNSALKTSPLLLRQLQENFTVGLIDEFQDTNDTQFEIFENIFLQNKQSTFIVVGDPRQAIYRFRNCDINTYLDAKKLMLEECKAQFFSMNTNHRSGEKYIDALNEIFTPAGSFAMADMNMPEQHAREGSKVLLTSDLQEITHPIQAAVSTEKKIDDICKHCAADICDLIDQKYMLPTDPPRPVEFGDIAVLTYKWGIAEKVSEALKKFGIPSRMMKGKNVFNTPESQQLLTFLEGILNYNSNDSLLRALITPLSDMTLDSIQSEKEVELRAGWFQELNELWHQRSFMIMYNTLAVKFKLNDRFGNTSILSNYNTIADILSEEEFNRNLTPFALLNSLQKHISRADDEEKNEFPGQPETDRGTVILDTVFGSKGLSYPIVYLPEIFYVGDSFNNSCISKTFHSNGTLCHAPLISKAEKAVERDEMIQENLRKAYVAFTRARYYCRFYCGECRTQSAPTDWLFRKHGITEFSNMYDRLKSFSKNAGWSFPEEISVTELPETIGEHIFPPQPAEQLRRPDLLPYLISQSGFLSFSGITPHTSSQSSLASEKEDEDSGEEENNSADTPKTQISPHKTMELPSGTNFGNAVHRIMEICNYSGSPEELTACTASQLRNFGIRGDSVSEISGAMLHNVLNSPIPAYGGGTFSLAQIVPEYKKCEFEFLYKFAGNFKSDELFSFAKKYFEGKFNLTVPESTAEKLHCDTGFFNGSIDLLFRHDGKFYIIDWKTNKLDSIKQYGSKTLPAAMAGSRYYVQYMIYTVALFKYLKQRINSCSSDEELYDRYIGGVRYIFVRGTYEEGHGIFCDRLTYGEFKQLEEIIG